VNAALRARLRRLEERAHRLGVLLGAGHQVQENLGAGAREPPGRQDRLAPLPGPDPLGDPVDEQIGDVVFAEIAGGEVLVVRPQPSTQLGDCRPGQEEPARLVLEGVLDVAYRKPACQHLDHPRFAPCYAASSASLWPFRCPRSSEPNGSAVPATCGAE
jgi:hypothetical protein